MAAQRRRPAVTRPVRGIKTLGFSAKPAWKATKSRCSAARRSRECVPKGTDLSQLGQQPLTAVEHPLNDHSRKILNFHSPHEVFSTPTLDFIRGVALQG